MAYPRTGLCLFVFCCRQAVTKRPSDRARWPYMVRECEEGLLLAQERKRGYRACCTALRAPSATELLQLLRWISADKKGALNRAGIQLADGCRSLACCYSAPPELDLIRMQPPPQPTWAASDGGGEAAQLPQAGSSGHQGPPAPATKVPRNSTHGVGSAAPTSLPKPASAAFRLAAGLQRCLREPAPVASAEEAASSTAFGPANMGSMFPEPHLFIGTSCLP